MNVASPSAPLRLAVVGIDHPHGAGWRRALELLRDRIQVTALVPRFNNATASLEERYCQAARFDTVESLVAADVCDAALVCLPNDESPAAAVCLAEAGKHLLLEKPGAGSPDEMARVAEAVERAGVAFQSGYLWRYDEGVARLREMALDGRFGGWVSIEMLYATSNVARRGKEHYLFDPRVSRGGFFNWLACHWLDTLLYIVARPITAVTARVGVEGGTPVEVEDGGVAILELEGGGLATFVGGYWIPRWAGESRWTLRGRDRWVNWDPARPGTGGVLEIHGPQPQWDAMEETFTLPVDDTHCYGGGRTLALLDDWLAAIAQPRERRAALRNSARSAQATLELIERIYESSREGRRVECRVEG